MSKSLMLSLFSSIAIFIALLGIIGLISHSASSRIKEIGIRKTLGASLMNIVTLLTKELLIVISIGIFIAYPIAYYLANNWLHTFAYRISISFYTFAEVGIAILILALSIISLKALKAAIMNPVDSLRNE